MKIIEFMWTSDETLASGGEDPSTLLAEERWWTDRVPTTAVMKAHGRAQTQWMTEDRPEGLRGLERLNELSEQHVAELGQPDRPGHQIVEVGFKPDGTRWESHDDGLPDHWKWVMKCKLCGRDEQWRQERVAPVLDKLRIAGFSTISLTALATYLRQSAS